MVISTLRQNVDIFLSGDSATPLFICIWKQCLVSAAGTELGDFDLNGKGMDTKSGLAVG